MLVGIPFSLGPECGSCGPGPAAWVGVGRKGTCQGGCWGEGRRQPQASVLCEHRLGDSASASGDHPSPPAHSIPSQVSGVGEGTLRRAQGWREAPVPVAQQVGAAYLRAVREGETRAVSPPSASPEAGADWELTPSLPLVLTTPALQLPLANDGGSRSPSSESSPQHPTPPARPRHMLGLPSTMFTPRSMER